MFDVQSKQYSSVTEPHIHDAAPASGMKNKEAGALIPFPWL
jgi:hypothetical protein